MRVVIGPLFPAMERIRAEAGSLNHPVEWSQQPASLRSLVEEADLAVSGAGQTLYELAWAGCPAVAVETAPNQEGQARALEAAGSLIRAGGIRDPEFPDRMEAAVKRLLEEKELRARMGRAGQSLVDGQGAARVAARIKECINGAAHAIPRNA